MELKDAFLPFFTSYEWMVSKPNELHVGNAKLASDTGRIPAGALVAYFRVDKTKKRVTCIVPPDVYEYPYRFTYKIDVGTHVFEDEEDTFVAQHKPQHNYPPPPPLAHIHFFAYNSLSNSIPEHQAILQSLLYKLRTSHDVMIEHVPPFPDTEFTCGQENEHIRIEKRIYDKLHQRRDRVLNLHNLLLEEIHKDIQQRKI